MDRRLFLFVGAYFLTVPAWGLDHGFDPESELTKWFESLHRKIDKFPCCGLGDAYPVEILQEATPDPKGELFDGIARVTNVRSITFPNGDVRLSIPTGTVIHFSDNQLTREIDGNPTATAWAFLSVRRNGDDQQDTSGTLNIDGEMHGVYCVVPLPPGF